MANRTVKDAKSIKGTNPQYLVEKIIRSRIYDCKYWKEECFALTAELLVDKAMDLRYVGGVVGGNVQPSPFLCLVLKMLQIQPEKDIIVEFIKNDDYKYVRCLGAFYMRLTGTSADCYNYLEPLLNDYRKVRRQNRSGEFELVYLDEFVDELLREERMCDIILPRIQKRQILEELNELPGPRISALEADDDDDDEMDADVPEEKVEKPSRTSHSKKHSDSGKSREKDKRRNRSESNSSDERRKGSERKRSRERDHHSSSHAEKRRKEDESSSKHRSKRDRDDRHEGRHGRDHDRDRDRERDRRRGHDSGHSKGRDRSRSRDRNRDRSRDRDRDRNHHRSRY